MSVDTLSLTLYITQVSSVDRFRQLTRALDLTIDQARSSTNLTIDQTRSFSVEL